MFTDTRPRAEPKRNFCQKISGSLDYIKRVDGQLTVVRLHPLQAVFVSSFRLCLSLEPAFWTELLGVLSPDVFVEMLDNTY